MLLNGDTAMHLSEFERRKRSLDEQLAAGTELLQAAHRAQVRALQLIWMTSPENRGSLPPELLAMGAEAVVASPPPAEPEAPAPPKRRKWKVGELIGAVQDAFDRLPETFDRIDIVAALGETPERSSLHRVLEDLLRGGALEIVQRGHGRVPTRFRVVYTEEDDEATEA